MKFKTMAGVSPYTKPRYQHDCPFCVFLGYSDSLFHGPEEKPGDIYICGNGVKYTFLIRYSDTPSDYFSLCPDELLNLPDKLVKLMNVARGLDAIAIQTKKGPGEIIEKDVL